MTTLHTQRLELRPMRADDAGPLMRLFGDAEFMAAFDRGPFDRREMDAWVERNLAHQLDHGYGLFTVVLRETGDIIGDCGLERMELDGHDEVELGYDLRRDQWGRGLATEAAAAAARHAFENLGLPRLVSLVRERNLRSARVVERIGMRPDRTLAIGAVHYVLYVLEQPAADA